MARRLALAITSMLLACSALGVLTQPAEALVGEPPTVGIPTITADSAASVQVSVSVDSHGSDTTVQVEYVTAGAYRARVPSAATTVTIGTTPASAAGPVTVTGQVVGLDPGSTYRMRVKASNVGGETVSADVEVATPATPKTVFKAKVGTDTTKLSKLTVTGATGVATGGEAAKVVCKTSTKGCPFASTVIPLVAGTTSLSKLLKRFPLDPGAKVVVQVIAAGARISTLTLTIRDDEQPKVKRR